MACVLVCLKNGGYSLNTVTSGLISKFSVPQKHDTCLWTANVHVVVVLINCCRHWVFTSWKLNCLLRSLYGHPMVQPISATMVMFLDNLGCDKIKLFCHETGTTFFVATWLQQLVFFKKKNKILPGIWRWELQGWHPSCWKEVRWQPCWWGTKRIKHAGCC